MDGQGFFDEDEFLSDDICHQAESGLCPQVESDHNSSSSYAADAVADAVNNTSFTHNNDGFPASTGANSFFNDPKHPAVSAFTLSFDKSTIIPITDEPPCLARTSSPPSKRQRAIRSAEHRNKSRSSSEVIHHIMTERRRTQDLTQKFIALAATIPGLKKVT
ncbi:transcription factor bHLH18-like [Neltuma alba]|uniref:transcription factor bHLH18-like n=1 Tax=Neltuma alba TaxID=207710 RepID=UPI0010A56C39|nr:transcription factor bHLH18-like [Prosopis alba]